MATTEAEKIFDDFRRFGSRLKNYCTPSLRIGLTSIIAEDFLNYAPPGHKQTEVSPENPINVHHLFPRPMAMFRKEWDALPLANADEVARFFDIDFVVSKDDMRNQPYFPIEGTLLVINLHTIVSIVLLSFMDGTVSWNTINERLEGASESEICHRHLAKAKEIVLALMKRCVDIHEKLTMEMVDDMHFGMIEYLDVSKCYHFLRKSQKDVQIQVPDYGMLISAPHVSSMAMGETNEPDLALLTQLRCCYLHSIEEVITMSDLFGDNACKWRLIFGVTKNLMAKLTWDVWLPPRGSPLVEMFIARNWTAHMWMCRQFVLEMDKPCNRIIQPFFIKMMLRMNSVSLMIVEDFDRFKSIFSKDWKAKGFPDPEGRLITKSRREAPSRKPRVSTAQDDKPTASCTSGAPQLHQKGPTKAKPKSLQALAGRGCAAEANDASNLPLAKGPCQGKIKEQSEEKSKPKWWNVDRSFDDISANPSEDEKQEIVDEFFKACGDLAPSMFKIGLGISLSKHWLRVPLVSLKDKTPVDLFEVFSGGVDYCEQVFHEISLAPEYSECTHGRYSRYGRATIKESDFDSVFGIHDSDVAKLTDDEKAAVADLRLIRFVLMTHCVNWCQKSWKDVVRSMEDCKKLGVFHSAWVQCAEQLALRVMSACCGLCADRGNLGWSLIMMSLRSMIYQNPLMPDDGSLIGTACLMPRVYLRGLEAQQWGPVFTAMAKLRLPILIDLAEAFMRNTYDDFQEEAQRILALMRKVDFADWSPTGEPAIARYLKYQFNRIQAPRGFLTLYAEGIVKGRGFQTACNFSAMLNNEKNLAHFLHGRNMNGEPEKQPARAPAAVPAKAQPSANAKRKPVALDDAGFVPSTFSCTYAQCSEKPAYFKKETHGFVTVICEKGCNVQYHASCFSKVTHALDLKSPRSLTKNKVTCFAAKCKSPIKRVRVYSYEAPLGGEVKFFAS